MALEAENAGRLQEIRIILSSMDIVTTEAGYATRVHDARDKIVALHAILVASSVREMRECRLAELVFF